MPTFEWDLEIGDALRIGPYVVTLEDVEGGAVRLRIDPDRPQVGTLEIPPELEALLTPSERAAPPR